MHPRQDVIELPDKHPLRIRAEKAEATVKLQAEQLATKDAEIATLQTENARLRALLLRVLAAWADQSAMGDTMSEPLYIEARAASERKEGQ
jgi:hypothetical protein